VAVRYLSRRFGRSQNGAGRGSSWSRPLAAWPLLAAWPPRWAGASASAGGWVGFGAGPDRCLAVTAGHPLDGQAGPCWPELPPLIGGGGAAPPERDEPEDLAGPVGPAADAARAREAAAPVDDERPAPRDQPDAAALAPPPFDRPALEPFDRPALDPPPCALGPPGPLAPDLDGRSSGGATRPPLSASGAFLLRAALAPTPVTTRREPVLASPSPSAGGGASGRNRGAYASLDALSTVPAAAASAVVAVPAPTPAATAAAWPGFLRAHLAAR
jgi:hypothetical protein